MTWLILMTKKELYLAQRDPLVWARSAQTRTCMAPNCSAKWKEIEFPFRRTHFYANWSRNKKVIAFWSWQKILLLLKLTAFCYEKVHSIPKLTFSEHFTKILATKFRKTTRALTIAELFTVDLQLGLLCVFLWQWFCSDPYKAL